MVSPAASCAVSTAPYQATTKLTPTVEASSKLNRSGLRTSASTGTDINSAWEPSRVNPVSPPVPQTAAPSHSGGPLITTPAKSRPGVRGNTVQSMAPATFFTSDGLTDAASTRMTASVVVAAGSGTSLIRRTPGSPNSLKRKARICLSSECELIVVYRTCSSQHHRAGRHPATSRRPTRNGLPVFVANRGGCPAAPPRPRRWSAAARPTARCRHR